MNFKSGFLGLLFVTTLLFVVSKVSAVGALQQETGTPIEGPTQTPTVTETPTPTESDTEPPRVDWIAPVQSGETYFVSGETVLSEVAAEDNVAVESVYFYWWNSVTQSYISIGTVSSAPYIWNFDTSILNEGYNQIFAKAYDTSGNESARKYVWFYYSESPDSTATPTSTSVPTTIYTPTIVATQFAQKSLFLPVTLRSIPPTPTATSTMVPTDVPTLTPTSTHTPTPPENTPTPTATSLSPSGVQILANHSHYVDSIEYLHVVGEVQNNTSSYLRFVKITVNFFNESNQFIGTDFTYTLLDNLPPGTKTCFENLIQEPAGWSYYQFENPSYWTDGQPLPNLAILNIIGGIDPTFGWYEISGQVRNDQGSRVEYVSPVMTLYNAGGTVLDCDFTYVNSTHLDPGQTSSFENTFAGRESYSDVSSYRIQVDGDVQ